MVCSTDSAFNHFAWQTTTVTENHPVKDYPYPMLADQNHEFCSKMGVLDQGKKNNTIKGNVTPMKKKPFFIEVTFPLNA